MNLFTSIMRLRKPLFCSSFNCFVSQMQKGGTICLTLGGFIEKELRDPTKISQKLNAIVQTSLTEFIIFLSRKQKIVGVLFNYRILEKRTSCRGTEFLLLEKRQKFHLCFGA